MKQRLSLDANVCICHDIKICKDIILVGLISILKWIKRYFKNENNICEVKGHPGPEMPSFDRGTKVFNTLLLCCCTSALHKPLQPQHTPQPVCSQTEGHFRLRSLLEFQIKMSDKFRVDMRMSQKYRLLCSRCNCHTFVTHLLIRDPDTDDTGSV